MRILKCKESGTIIEVVSGSETEEITCCGNPMKELKANSTDASGEKHVPVIKVDGRNVEVTVGSVEHPMLEEHYITFVQIVTKKGMQRQNLTPGSAPKAVFTLAEGDELIAAYEYCNLHGLWKIEA